MEEKLKVGIPTPDDLKEAEKLQNTCKSMDIELQGKIFLVQKDENGEEVLRDELDSEIVLKAILAVVSDSLSSSLLDTP